VGEHLRPRTEGRFRSGKRGLAGHRRCAESQAVAAEAHRALGYWHYWGFRDYEPAKIEFRRALQLSPNNAQTIAALGFVQRRQGQWADAVATLVRAIAYTPRDSGLIGNYGQTNTVMRRYGEAERALRRGLALDPDDMQSRAYLTINDLIGDGDAQAALTVFADLPLDRRAPASNTDGDVMNVVDARVYPYLFLRRFDDALSAWPTPAGETPTQHVQRLSARVAIQMLAGRRVVIQAQCSELRGLLLAQREQEQATFKQTSALSWAELCLGHDDEARRIAQLAAQTMPSTKDAWTSSYFLVGEAQIDAQTGHVDEAIAIIKQLLAIAAGDAMSIQRLKLDPVWDPLRGDPRFAKLIADGTEARL
jgi:tetratricopeptide (TPR) repeat protein